MVMQSVGPLCIYMGLFPAAVLVSEELPYGEMRHGERGMFCSARVSGEVIEKVETSSLIHSITKICGARSVPDPIQV